ncbi:MAG: hypothetical protein K2N64_05320, partial [Anaeroplasmataceae bacterium]|nr:hypothetical protein [Anaeroplasmataceae bacterium]
DIWDLPAKEEQPEEKNTELAKDSTPEDIWDMTKEEDFSEEYLEENELDSFEQPKFDEQEAEEDDSYAYEEQELEVLPQRKEPREVKITEGEKYIVKETKSSLFIREKDPIRKIDNGEDEEEEIPFRQVNFYDK